MLPSEASWELDRRKSDCSSRRPRHVRDYRQSAGGQCPLDGQNGRRETKELDEIVHHT